MPRRHEIAGKPTLKVIGGFQMLADGTEIILSSRKERAFVVYLALNAGRALSRESLASVLWGDTTDARARSNLRHCLYMLRRALGDCLASRLVVNDREGLVWSVEAVEVDLHRLRALVSNQTPAALSAAAELFRGELLDGFILGEAGFDEWLDNERRSFLRLVEDMVAGLVQFSPAEVAPRLATRAAEMLVAIDPLNEEAQRLLMSAYLATGRRTDAARQYRKYTKLLRSELDVTPEPATKRLYQSIASNGTGVQPMHAVAKETSASTQLFAAETPPLSEWPSIAVLPFSTSDCASTDAYLGQGLADEVIELLYRYRWLRVVARGSSFNYRSHSSDPQKVAAELDVRYVVHGSVQRLSGRVRCMAQVLDATTGECLWANHFDNKFDDIFVLLDDLARSLVGELEPALGRIERRRATQAAPNDLSAWSCYHRGLEHFYMFRRDDNPKAVRLLSRACLLDPVFAPAYAHLAIARHWSMMHGYSQRGDGTLCKALKAATRAMELDPGSALGRYARSRIHFREGKFAEAFDDVERAITASPSFAGGHFALGWYYNHVGRFADTHLAIGNAMRLSPQDPEFGYFCVLRARACVGERNYQEAVAWARRGLNEPNASPLPLLSTLVSALGHLGTSEEAAQALHELERVTRRPRTVRLYRDLMTTKASGAFLENFLEGLRRAGMPD